MLVGVTGSSGYLGSALMTDLLAQGIKVKPILRTGSHAAPHWFVDSHDALSEPFSLIYHLAGPSRGQLASNPGLAVNYLQHTRELVETYLMPGGTFVYFSTFHVYGSRPCGDVTEIEPSPSEAYSEVRLEVEQMLRQLAANSRAFDLLVLRIPNVFGSGRRLREVNWRLFPNEACRTAVEQHVIRIVNDPQAQRIFLDLNSWLEFVTDLDHLQRLAVRAPDPIPLGSGESLSLIEFAQMVAAEARVLTGQRCSIESHTIDGAHPRFFVPPLTSQDLLRARMRLQMRKTMVELRKNGTHEV